MPTVQNLEALTNRPEGETGTKVDYGCSDEKQEKSPTEEGERERHGEGANQREVYSLVGIRMRK